MEILMIRVNRKITGDLGNYINYRYGVDMTDDSVPQELTTALINMQYWIDEVLLGKYFANNESAETEGTYWTQQLEFDSRQTGKKLQERLESMPDAQVLDIGCGANDFKKLLGDRVYGIDPYHDAADEKVGIMQFKPTRDAWDVVLCLGSINFGDEQTIKSQVSRVVNWVKPGGLVFWRCNPGITHDNKHAEWIDFYDWSHEQMNEWAAEYGFEVVESGWDHQEEKDTIRWGNRLYQEWRKKDA
jgi:cyclopropane fatty-acyl-phospholipid synthase-like methyltransferase